MKFQGGSRSTRYRVCIPQLFGGLNTKDALHLVDDTQLTDMSNMWWKDGTLHTRPGIVYQRSHPYSGSQKWNRAYDTNADGTGWGKYCLHAEPEPGGILTYRYTAYFYGDDGQITDCGGFPMQSMITPTGEKGRAMIVKETKVNTETSLFAIVNSGQVMGKDRSTGEWAAREPYIPLVLLNGKGGSSTSSPPLPMGAELEGGNLLTGAFKARYTTDGVSHVFTLPQKPLTAKGNETITISYTAGTGSLYTLTIASSLTQSDPVSVEGTAVHAAVDRTRGMLVFLKSDNTPYCFPSHFFGNNLEILAWKSDAAALQRICGCTFHTWYGGDRSGLNGGIRLFVSGNAAHPNLIHWSEANNPLYFPARNYAFVGDEGQAVTAFAKQSNMLVIFKERELYYIDYSAGNNSALEDVLAGRPIDLTAYTANFPIIPINQTIGCDCPDSIELCQNHLIWAHSTGKIYSLANVNPFNELNVEELSVPVQSKFKSLSAAALQAARAGEYGGQYVLLCGNTLFLLACGQKERPWSVWETIPNAQWEWFIATGERAVLCGRVAGVPSLFCFQGDEDVLCGGEKKKIACRFQTKLFDFSYPERLKNLTRLDIGIANIQGSKLHFSYVTDKGTAEDAYTVEIPEGVPPYSPNYITRRRLTPGSHRIRQFALQVRGEGAMAVDGIVLHYQLYEF